ncbi:hypothetical protein SARC_15232, partial [Sphaeroforma arctica JP610]
SGAPEAVATTDPAVATDSAGAMDGSHEIDDLARDGASVSDADVPSDGVVFAPANEVIPVSLGSEAASIDSHKQFFRGDR